MKNTRGFWIPALVLALAYGLAEALGLRRYATFLSGTALGGDFQTSAALGAVYLGLYFAWTVVCPVLVLASVIYGVFFTERGVAEAPAREAPR